MRIPAERLIPLLAVAAMLTACGARTPPAAVPPPVNAVTPAAPAVPTERAADLLRRGCFACLERALLAAREQDAPQIAFEAAALLAVRAKELGLAPDPWLQEARALAGDEPFSRLVLEIVDALPADPRAGSRDAVLAQTPARRRARVLLAEWMRALDTGPGSAVFRNYLQLALACTSDDAAAPKAEEVAAGFTAEARAAPLVEYRLGLCGSDQQALLRSVRSRDPEFTDADYPLARYMMQVREYPDVDGALRLLQSAAAAFPQSPAIATTAGDLFRTIEAWTEALAAYDAATALIPDHPDAIIGRTIALSHLGEHHTAIAAATRLVDRGRWFVGQALYWRAWNHVQLGTLAAARADADRARVLVLSAGVYLLSGVIDWRLGRLDTAEREFEEALKIDDDQCDAALFLGGVRNERARIPEALTALRQALQCYDRTIALRNGAIARLATADATPAYKARERARHQRALDEAGKRRGEALNGIDLIEEYLTSSRRPPRSPAR